MYPSQRIAGPPTVVRFSVIRESKTSSDDSDLRQHSSVPPGGVGALDFFSCADVLIPLSAELIVNLVKPHIKIYYQKLEKNFTNMY